MLKYLVRKLAVWRRLNEYAGYETYSWRDAGRMLFATERTVLDRPAYGGPRSLYHSHYGFNMSGPRACRRRIRDRADALYAGGTVARMAQQSGLVRLPAAIAATRNANARFV